MSRLKVERKYCILTTLSLKSISKSMLLLTFDWVNNVSKNPDGNWTRFS